MKLVVATTNPGKRKEIEVLLAPLGWEIVSLNEFSEYNPPQETGRTFCENAVIKARAAAMALGLPAVADDSGLEVDALAGRPGVYSARFAGPGATDEENNRLLLARLADCPPHVPRTARFVCCLALAWPGGRVETFSGVVEGRVLEAPRGSSGFGYDPLFWSPELGKTFGEATPEEKNRVSHRRRALDRLVAYLARCGREGNHGAVFP